MSQPTNESLIRFGLFDFHPTTRELRRESIPVRLQPQPAQVLGLLLAKPGEVVTREELREALWGADTFVDFDRSLNFCIAQIRSALRDSAESPLYIKTIPKRGYQFIAPLITPATAKPLAPIRLYAALALLVVLAALAYVYNSRPAPLRVAVARFDNQTPDPAFDRFTDALTDAVVGELTTSGERKYEVIGNAKILRGPRSQRDLVAIHTALNADFIVLGEAQQGPGGIEVFAQLIGLPDQAHVKVTRISNADPDPLKAQADLAKRIVQALSPRLTHGPKR